MEKQQFLDNLKKIYDFSSKLDKEISEYYSVSEESGKRKEIDDFLKENEIEINGESRLAFATRIVSLRDISLVQELKKQDFSDEKIKVVKENAYPFVKEIYNNKFGKLIEKVENEKLLDEFHLEVFKGVHSVGQEMNRLQVSWLKRILEVNEGLLREFGTKENVLDFLRDEGLMDKGHYDLEADRCYTVLGKKEGKYVVETYLEAFSEVEEVIDKLKEFRSNLEKYEDEIFGKKKEYLNYLDSLVIAFSGDKRHDLVSLWADVDLTWMQLDGPIQIVHPLEFYEDAFRKAVAPEWDLRITNLNLPKNKRQESIEKMYDRFLDKFGKEKYSKVYEESKLNLKKVQLHLSKPVLLYGARLLGMTSAQVVPNDLEVSKTEGKKIFAFADMILNKQREKPFTKFGPALYSEEYIKDRRTFLFNETEMWHKIYDLETIGHEYGHVLWLDDRTEPEMNKSGEFKNIEEFKATMGAIISFFLNEEWDEQLKEEFIDEVGSRAISLTIWKDEEEVRPYYCEGLVHLKGFFETGIVNFDGEKVRVKIKENYSKLREWYLSVYEDLARHYLEKKDAKEFLDKYVEIIDGKYVSRDLEVRKFCEFYFKKYQELGNQIDETVKKEDYVL